MNQFKFFVPGPLPGLNEVIETCRGTKGKGSIMAAARQKDEWTERVCIYALTNARMKPVKFERVFVHLLWAEPNQKRDPDNISSAKKFVLDGLIRAGIIENDGWKQIAGFRDEWTLDTKKPGVYVTIVGMEVL